MISSLAFPELLSRGSTMDSDFDYFRRRAQEEREAAVKASHPAVRRAHVDMAGRYDELRDAIASHQRLLHPAKNQFTSITAPRNDRL